MRALLRAVLLVAAGCLVIPACLAAEAAAQPPPSAPVRVGGNIRPPAKLHHVRPVYPPDAERARVSGVVIVEITIDTEGMVSNARVLRGVPMLNDAALDAVTQWQFTPTLLNGMSVPVIMTVHVNFSPGMKDDDGGDWVSPSGSLPPTVRASGPGAVSPGTAALGAVAAAPAAMGDASQVGPFQLTPTRAGLLRVGMRAQDVFTTIPLNQIVRRSAADGSRPNTLEIVLEPGGPTALILTAGRADGATTVDTLVTQIDVRSERFRTADGLGVGSTLAELRARDPGLRTVSTQDGLSAVMSDMTYAFVLDAPPADGGRAAAISDATRVTRVLLGSPQALLPMRR